MRALFQLISLRHLGYAHRARSLLAVAGIALGVGAVVATAVAYDSVLGGLREAAALFGGKRSLVVSGGSGVPSDVVTKVGAVPGVLDAAPLISQQAPLLRVDGRQAAGSLWVVGAARFDGRGLPVAMLGAGTVVGLDAARFAANPRAVIVSEAFAVRHGISHEKQGSRVSISTAKGELALVVAGVWRPESASRVQGLDVAIMNLAGAQSAFAKVGRVDEVHALLAEDATPARLARVRARIASAVGASFDVSPPFERSRASERLVGSLQLLSSLLALVALLVGGFLVFEGVAASVAERRREIGVLRALGASRAMVVRLFALEGLVLGAAGAALGAVLGLLGARSLVAITSGSLSRVAALGGSSELYISPWSLLLGVGLGAGVSVLAALLPALGAARVSPFNALQESTRDTRARRRSRWVAFVGLVLIGVAAGGVLHPATREEGTLAFTTIGCLLLGFVALCPVIAPLVLALLRRTIARAFGVVGALAADHLQRAQGRVGAAVTAVVLGIALAFSSSALEHSFESAMRTYLERGLPADLVVTSAVEPFAPAPVPMEAHLRDALAAVPGVARVIDVRVVPSDVAGRPVEIVALDVGEWARRGALAFVDAAGNTQVDEVSRGDGVFVSDALARTLGLSRNDELTVRARRGVVRLKVSGVLVDSARPHGVLTLDRGLFQRHWGGETADAFHLFLAPGHEAATVRAALEASLKERPGIRVLTHADFKRALARVIDDTLGLAKVQAVAAAAVAWITLVNILLLQVERRKVEIAVLRVIGATPAQIVRLVWVESILLVLVGALLGALLGFALSWVSTLVVGAVHVGWRVPYRFDPVLLAWLLPGALLAAALAALGPGRRAAREPITRAILGD